MLLERLPFAVPLADGHSLPLNNGVVQSMELPDSLRQGTQKYQAIFVILENCFVPITAGCL